MARSVPREIDAEKAVLGSIMLNANVLDELQSLLADEDFYEPRHQSIFIVARKLREQARPVDAVSLAERLSKQNELENVGGAIYLGSLMESVPHTANVSYYADLVIKAARRRRLIQAAEAAIEAAHGTGDTADIVAECEGRLHSLLEAEADTQSLDVRTALEGVFYHLDHEEPPGLPMGWLELDKIYQLQPGNLVYVAARPSMGKTGLAANIVINVASRGKKCLLFSLEQSHVEMAGRLLSAWTQISSTKINRMDPISQREREQLLAEASGLADLPIGIDDDPDASISKIAAKARLWKRRHGLDLLVIDYLQLIEPEDRRINREQQVAVISRTLKKLAGQLEIPVICLAQLNRMSESRPDKRPHLSDLRESGSLEQDANCVILIHRPEFYRDEDRPGEADLIIAKNRNGRTGTVPLQFEKSTITFRDLSRRSESYQNGWPTN